MVNNLQVSHMPHIKISVLAAGFLPAVCLLVCKPQVGVIVDDSQLANLKKSVNYQQPANEVCSPITLSQNQVDSLTTKVDTLMLFGAEKITLACHYLA